MCLGQSLQTGSWLLAELGRPASADCPGDDKAGCWEPLQVLEQVREQLKIMAERQNGLEVAKTQETMGRDRLFFVCGTLS